MIIVKTPELAESVAEATLLDWQKQPGDAVAEGEILVSVETDKIVLEVYAPQGGVLQEILKKEGDSVVSDEPLARIDETAQAASAPAPAPKAAEKPQPAPAPAPVATAASATSEPAAMPSARKIAAERGIELSAIEGSGRGGRITKSDALAATTQSSPSAPAAGRETQREPMSRLRARVAERMLLSQRQSASLTTFNEADMSAVIALRRAHRDAFEARHGVKLGFMGFFVKAATAASASLSDRQFVDRRRRDFAPELLRHLRRRRRGARACGAGVARRGANVDRANRSRNRRFRGARQRRLADARRSHRRNFHRHQRRRFRLDDVDADSQSAAKRDFGHARH